MRTDIQTAIAGVDNLLDEAVQTINKLPGVDITAPTIQVPSLDFLNNVTLPTDMLNALSSLNASIPTLAELRDKMDSIIAIPFEDLRAEINGTLKDATVDRSLMPVPARSTLTFCNVRICMRWKKIPGHPGLIAGMFVE